MAMLITIHFLFKNISTLVISYDVKNYSPHIIVHFPPYEQTAIAYQPYRICARVKDLFHEATLQTLWLPARHPLRGHTNHFSTEKKKLPYESFLPNHSPAQKRSLDEN